MGRTACLGEEVSVNPKTDSIGTTGAEYYCIVEVDSMEPNTNGY